jgi:hypothetical protein
MGGVHVIKSLHRRPTTATISHGFKAFRNEAWKFLNRFESLGDPVRFRDSGHFTNMGTRGIIGEPASR